MHDNDENGSDADLSEDALEQACSDVMKLTKDRGLLIRSGLADTNNEGGILHDQAEVDPCEEPDWTAVVTYTTDVRYVHGNSIRDLEVRVNEAINEGYYINGDLVATANYLIQRMERTTTIVDDVKDDDDVELDDCPF